MDRQRVSLSSALRHRLLVTHFHHLYILSRKREHRCDALDKRRPYVRTHATASKRHCECANPHICLADKICVLDSCIYSKRGQNISEKARHIQEDTPLGFEPDHRIWVRGCDGTYGGLHSLRLEPPLRCRWVQEERGVSLCYGRGVGTGKDDHPGSKGCSSGSSRLSSFLRAEEY